MTKKLTAPQQRYLEEIRAAGQKVYNNNARRTLEALEAAGLITVDWDMVPHTKGSGFDLVGHNTARPVAPAIEIKLSLAPPRNPAGNARTDRNWTLVIHRTPSFLTDHISLYTTHANDLEGAQAAADAELVVQGLEHEHQWWPVGWGFKTNPITIWPTNTIKEEQP